MPELPPCAVLSASGLLPHAFEVGGTDTKVRSY